MDWLRVVLAAYVIGLALLAMSSVFAAVCERRIRCFEDVCTLVGVLVLWPLALPYEIANDLRRQRYEAVATEALKQAVERMKRSRAE